MIYSEIKHLLLTLNRHLYLEKTFPMNITTFVARINLHHASVSDYKNLVAEMKKASFVPNKNQASESTPEFIFRGSQVLNDVMAAVMRAAVKTGKKFSFTVMKEKQFEKNLKSSKRLAF